MATDRRQEGRNVYQENLEARDALQEVRKRLVSLHYELAEGPFGDRDLQRRTRGRLADLLTFVNETIGPTETSPQARTTGHV